MYINGQGRAIISRKGQSGTGHAHKLNYVVCAGISYSHDEQLVLVHITTCIICIHYHVCVCCPSSLLPSVCLSCWVCVYVGNIKMYVLYILGCLIPASHKLTIFRWIIDLYTHVQIKEITGHFSS